MAASRIIVIATAALTVAAWCFRWYVEYRPTRPAELAWYIGLPLVSWLLVVLPVAGLDHRRTWVRVVTRALLVPTSLWWLLVVIVGFRGLKIH